ncbi:MAG TPA: amidase [Acidimicrobiales bacterium]|nr:amidase [Acidimicrobiales bacterium]
MDPFASACEVARAVRARQASPLEVLDACLERIEAHNPRLNAIVWLDEEAARRRAARAARRLSEADPEGIEPFLGVPIPIKDLVEVAGWPTTLGSRAVPDSPSKESELVVAALERAGFNLVGRTNTPELGPLTVTENLRYGTTRNPWDPVYSPGGSSGGAGAAVASGMVPVAHGNDGGGSIRIPASCCGLVGLKPSRGRVPTRAFSWEGAVVEGVLTHTVEDAAAVLDVVSGPDPLAWYNAPAPLRPFAQEVGADPGRLRVALLERAPLGLPVDPECRQALRETGALLESLGHLVEPTELDVAPAESLPAFLNLVNAGYADQPVQDWEAVEPHNLVGYRRGRALDSLSYVESVRSLQRTTRRVVAAWGRDFDLMVTPTMAITPPPAGQVLAVAHADPESTPPQVLSMAAFTMPFNVSGQPAVSLPLGWSSAGLPVGVQLVGPPFGESLLVRVASQLEQARPWRQCRPPLD